MLVLQPNTFMEMDGPAGEAVRVTALAVSVGCGAPVFVDVEVNTITGGVDVLTPMITGVGV